MIWWNVTVLCGGARVGKKARPGGGARARVLGCSICI